MRVSRDPRLSHWQLTNLLQSTSSLQRLLPEGVDKQHDHYHEPREAAGQPEVSLVVLGIGDASQVHAEVRREEGEGQEDGGDDGEKENGLVLVVRHDCELVLLDGPQ